MDKCPINAHVFKHLVPNYRILFGKDVEPLRGGALLKEVGH